MSDFYNKYPYTDFHELNLDWVIERVKKLTEDWLTTQQEWNDTEEQWQQLHDYVMNYFENLDVQDEINNKINAMISDGTFLSIVTPTINQTVIDTATAWLADNITPTTPPLDKSLSIGDAAADAQMTGLYIKALQNTSGYEKLFEYPMSLGNTGVVGWFADTSSYASYIIPVKSGDVIHAENGAVATQFAFLQDKPYYNLQQCTFSASYPSKLTFAANGTIEYTIPADTHYFWIWTKNNGVASLPLVVKLNGYSLSLSTIDYIDNIYTEIGNTNAQVSTNTSDILSDHNAIQDNKDTLGYNILEEQPISLGNTGVVGVYADTSTWASYIINVEPGQIFEADNGDTASSFAFLQDVPSYNLQQCTFSSSYPSKLTFGVRANVKYTIPSDTVCVWIMTKHSGTACAPVEVKLNTASIVSTVIDNFKTVNADIILNDDTLGYDILEEKGISVGNTGYVGIYDTPDQYGSYVLPVKSGDILEMTNGATASQLAFLITEPVYYGQTVLFSSSYPTKLTFASNGNVKYTIPNDTHFIWILTTNNYVACKPVTVKLNHVEMLDSVYDNMVNIMRSSIFGKTINILGDSYTAGSNKWHTFIQKRTDCIVNNYGVIGSTITVYQPDDDRTDFLARFNSMSAIADMIIIFGGINDSWQLHESTITLGDMTSTNIHTFYGALKTLCEALLHKYPTATIIALTPPLINKNASQDFNANINTIVEAEKEIYTNYGIPYLDLRTASTISNVAESVAEYYQSATDIHWNEAGHIRASYPIQNYIENYSHL